MCTGFLKGLFREIGVLKGLLKAFVWKICFFDGFLTGLFIIIIIYLFLFFGGRRKAFLRESYPFLGPFLRESYPFLRPFFTGFLSFIKGVLSCLKGLF